MLGHLGHCSVQYIFLVYYSVFFRVLHCIPQCIAVYFLMHFSFRMMRPNAWTYGPLQCTMYFFSVFLSIFQSAALYFSVHCNVFLSAFFIQDDAAKCSDILGTPVYSVFLMHCTAFSVFLSVFLVFPEILSYVLP